MLDSYGVDLVGIGMKSDISDFVSGSYFAGSIFFDRDMKIYKALRLSWLGVHRLFDQRTLAAYALAGQKGIEGNWRNSMSGTQLGATYVISESGAVLFEHRQDHFADYTDNRSVLAALGIPLAELPPPSPEPQAN